MQTEKQRSWKINVQARSKDFNFKFKATRIVPDWKFHRISILLRLHNFLLKVKSESGTSNPRQIRRTLKSKFLSVFQKLRIRRAKNPNIAVKKILNLQHQEIKFPQNRFGRLAYEEPICIGCLVVGILAFLSQSISEKDQTGIIIHSLVILLHVALLLKRYISGKTSPLLTFLTFAAMVGSVVFHLENYKNYYKGHVSELVWKAWNYAAASPGFPGFPGHEFVWAECVLGLFLGRTECVLGLLCGRTECVLGFLLFIPYLLHLPSFFSCSF